MNIKAIGTMTTAASLALAAFGQAGADDRADAAFLQEVISSNAAEIELGRLARQRSADEDVRDFAETLIEDHERSMEEARELAQERSITAPAQPTPEQQQHYAQLSQLAGSQFDREWVSHMVEAHQMAVDKFRSHAETGDSPVAEFAEETLPTLEDHLEEAEDLQEQALQSRADR